MHTPYGCDEVFSAASALSVASAAGGIHPPADDLPGRHMGEEIGPEAFNHAVAIFAGRISCPADLALPQGTLDFSDVVAYLEAFSAGEPEADFVAPFGAFDFFDVLSFLNAFSGGCP